MLRAVAGVNGGTGGGKPLGRRGGKKEIPKAEE